MACSAVISGSGGIAAVREFLVGVHGRRRLAHELGAMVADDHTIAAVRLHRAKLKPGRKLSGWYTVDVAGPAGDRRRYEAAVTWTPGGDEAEAAEPAGDGGDRAPSAPFRTLERRLPEWGMRVRIFPLDSDLPGLARLADPSAVSALLREPFPPLDSVVAIRYRPGERHVLRYAGSAPGSRSVFAKVHRGAAAAAGRTAAVADWLSREPCGVAVGRPLAALPSDEAAVYAGLHGRPAAVDPADLRIAGAALCALHAAPADLVAGAVSHRLDAELALVERACQHICALLPDAGHAISAMLDRTRVAYGRLPGEEATFVHGDAKLDHFWHTAGGLTLLDLDRSGPGDPAFDIGKLLADVRCRFALAHLRGVTEMQRAFLDGYGGDSARLGRARVYEAILLVKMAGRRVPLFHPHWADVTFSLLAAAGTALEQAGERPARRPASAHTLVGAIR